jgi:outer membrane protein TolC
MEAIVAGPVIEQTPQVPSLAEPRPSEIYKPLPINLATALRLSQARPLIIAAAQAGVEQAAAKLKYADVLWLPDVHFGADYSHHDGANQETDGNIEFASFGSFYSGGGATLDFGVTDAIFQPLAANQELRARQFNVQTARNDALLIVALNYFDVQEARGKLAGILDSAAKTEVLLKQIEAVSAEGLTPKIEAERAKALLADLNQQAVSARTNWNIYSARLVRALRLCPGSVIVPLEPPHMQVTLISSQCSVDDLIPCGLMNRPELASQKAVVQATLELLRQERLRPFVPSVVLAGRGPDNTITGGTYGGGTGGSLDTFGGRAEFDLGLIWTLRNLGMGNRALVSGRAADREKACIELADVQDRIAEEVAQAFAQSEGTKAKIPQAAVGLNAANATFIGTLKNLSQIRGIGAQPQLVSRPQEAVAAIQQLARAYDQYFDAVNAYNRSQFQLYHALGYPPRIIDSQRQWGDAQNPNADTPP